MKLVIYYSLTGSLDEASNIFRDKGYDTLKVVTKWNPPKNKFAMFMSCGFLAWIGKRMKLVDFNPDLSKYDEIIIASPIWNGHIACPINTVFKQLNLNDKKVTVILTSSSGKAKCVLKKLNKKNMASDVIVLKDPKHNPQELDKIRNL